MGYMVGRTFLTKGTTRRKSQTSGSSSQKNMGLGAEYKEASGQVWQKMNLDR